MTVDDRPLCDNKFCDALATWYNPSSDAYACDEHVPPDHAGWVQPLGWLSDVSLPDTKMTDMSLAMRLERSLTNHTPSAEQLDRIEEVRDAGKALAWALSENCTESRERALAATHLEETIMWAVKSIVLES